MKAMKKIIPALCLLLVTAVLMGTSTYAWFSMNRSTTATGMKVQAVASSSLAISTASPVGTLTTVNFTSGTSALIPATRYDSTKHTPGGSDTANSGLIHITNYADVDAATGLAATPAYEYCANTDESKYYVDYTVYIASSGEQMTSQNLKAKLFVDATEFAKLEDTTKAISVDFYATTSADSIGAYKGTLNLAGLDADSKKSTGSVELLSATGGVIPKNGTGTGTGFIKVTMRVYFDGALEKSANQAYVYSNLISTLEISFSVEFTASDAPTA